MAIYRNLFFWLLLPGFFALSVLIPRVEWEKKNRNVLIVVDWTPVNVFLASEGKDWKTALEEIPREGVVFALTERKFEECAGIFFHFSREGNEWRIEGQGVEDWFSFRVPPHLWFKVSEEEIRYSGPLEYLKGGCGWDGQQIELLRTSGFPIILRPYNPPLDDLWVIHSYLAVVEQFSYHHLLLPAGAEYLGFPAHLEEVKKIAALPAYVEFVAVEGADFIASSPNSVKVHSVSEKEWKAGEKRILARLLRAVQERNIRVLYLHFPQDGNLKTTAQFLANFIALLKKRGYTPGWQEPPLPPPPLPTYATYILHILIFLFFFHFFPEDIPKMLTFPFFGFMGLFWIFGLFSTGMHTIWMMIWVALFPWVTYVHLFGKSAWQWEMHSLLSVLGGLIFSSALSSPALFKGTQPLPWVKIAWAIPLLLSALFLLKYLWGENFWSKGITYEEVLLYLAVAGFFVYIFLREELGIGVSSVEVALREHMEKWLGIRPRWREILGHPVYLFAHRARLPLQSSSVVVYLLGLVGQVSVINSFLHLHTPLILVLLRVFYGIFFGGILGYFLYGGLSFYEHFSGRVLWRRESGR
ncbi:MAG: DUF5693 family protein [bacterium JZ-2024 1]